MTRSSVKLRPPSIELSFSKCIKVHHVCIVICDSITTFVTRELCNDIPEQMVDYYCTFHLYVFICSFMHYFWLLTMLVALPIL